MSQGNHTKHSEVEASKGNYSIGKKTRKTELIKLYIKESRSIRDVAEILGWKKDKVHYWLNKYDIRRDKRIRKSKLQEITLAFLEKEFKTKTKVQVAKELGVSRETIHRKYNKLKHNIV